MAEANLVIIRHGRSEWNNDRRMTGWSDVQLNPRGRKEAREAGRTLRGEGYRFDLAFTSWLQRAEETLAIVLKELGQADLPVQRSWRLNERHYGTMQGMSRDEAKQKYGLEQFKAWQTGYVHRPPAVAESDSRFPGNDPRYAGLPSSALPRAESMKDTLQRVMPCWEEDIAPALRDRQAGTGRGPQDHGARLAQTTRGHLRRGYLEDARIDRRPYGLPPRPGSSRAVAEVAESGWAGQAAGARRAGSLGRANRLQEGRLTARKFMNDDYMGAL